MAVKEVLNRAKQGKVKVNVLGKPAGSFSLNPTGRPKKK